MTGSKQIIGLLTDAQVNYILVGGFACIIYGSQIATDDIDICYDRAPSNRKRLAHALAPLHPRLRGTAAGMNVPFDEHSLAQGTNFTLVTDEGFVDLLAELSGVGGYPDLVVNATKSEFGGVSCRIASLDDIIRSKAAANRPKDRERLPELKALKLLRDAAEATET